MSDSIDLGYAWVVLIVAFLANVMTSCLLCAPALYMPEWAESFNTSRAHVAWISSINAGIKLCTGVLTGALIHCFSCRSVMFVGSIITALGIVLSVFAPTVWVLYITFGVVAGVGVGLMFSPPIIIIYDYFDKYKSIAVGLSMCGHSFAVIALVPLIRLLIDEYGWRGSLFWFSGILLNGCVLAFAFRPINKKTEDAKTQKDNSVKHMFDLSILTEVNFLLFALSYASNLFQMTIAYQMYNSKVVAEGMHKFNAAMLVSVIGLSALISRVLFSIISNLSCTNHTLVFGICTTIFGVFNAFSFIPWNFITHAFVCVVFGAMVAGTFTVTPPVLVDLLGKDRLPGSYGWTNLLAGLQSLLSLPLAGLLFDLTGDFDASFYMAGAMGIFGGILSLIIVLRLHRQKRQHEETEKNIKEEETFVNDEMIKPVHKSVILYASSEFGSQIIVK